MFCTKCGKECKEEMRFCPFCGEPATVHQVSSFTPPYNPYGQQPPQHNQPYGQQPYGQPQGSYYPPPPPPPPPPPVQPVTAVHMALKNVFVSDFFKFACIVNIIQAVISFLSSDGVPIIPILVAVVMWSLRDIALKNQHPSQFAEKLKILRIVVIIEYVFTWIAVGILGILGMIFGTILPTFISEIPFDMFGEPISSIADVLIDNGFLLTMAFFAVGAVVALYNVFFIGNCMKLVKSAENSASSGLAMFESVDTVSKWFCFLGILNAISAATSFTSLFSELPPLLNVVLFIASLVSGVLSAFFYIYLHKCLKLLKEQLGAYSAQY